MKSLSEYKFLVELMLSSKEDLTELSVKNKEISGVEALEINSQVSV
ncbi:MAG: hypothetical protein ACRC6T_14615 [Sarcina sp.]